MPESEEGALLVAGVTRIEEADYVHALRDHPLQRRLIRFFGAAVVLAFLAAAWAVVTSANGVAILMPCMIGGIFAFFGWKLWNAGRDQYRAMAEWQRQLRFELFEHHLRIHTERTSVDYEWSVFDPFIELAAAFVVAVPAQAAAGRPILLIIPKSAFAKSEVDRVREVLSARIRATPHAPAKGVARFVWKAVILWVLLIGMFVAIYQLVASGPAPEPDVHGEPR
jgi:hypothetical protein